MPKKIKENRRSMWRFRERSVEEEKYTEFWCGDTKIKSNLEDIGEDERVILREA
jgi:hypothetical protein